MALHTPGNVQAAQFGGGQPSIAGYKPENLQSEGTWLNILQALKDDIEAASLTNAPNGRCLLIVIGVEGVLTGAGSEASVPAHCYVDDQQIPADTIPAMAAYNGAFSALRLGKLAEDVHRLWVDGDGSNIAGTQANSPEYPVFVYTP